MINQSGDSQQTKLAALYEVSAKLGTTLDLRALLNLVMDSIIQLTGAERGFVVLTDNVTGELQTMAARNMDQETIAGRSMEISRTVVQRVMKNGRGIVTDNAQEDDRFSGQESVVGYQLRSILCAPLRTRGRIIGAAFVDNRLFSGVFSREDLDLLEAFTNQAAMAIDNARLFTQTDQALARRVEELTLFQRIDQELNKSLDLDRVLSLALDWAITLTEAESGSIGLMEQDEEGERILKLLAHSGSNVHQLPAVSIVHPVLAQVLAEKVSVQTHNVTAEQAIDGSPIVSQLAVPIKREGEVTGLITLESQRLAQFGQEDVAFVERLADRAAVAIENSRLYEAIQAANTAKNEFISIVTHELRLPMTSIKGYTDLILSQMVGSLNEQQSEFLQIVKRNLERMSILIRDLSDINRIESGRMIFELDRFSLMETVDDVVDTLRESIDTREQELVLDLPDNLSDIYADQNRISQVLSNLISNANKYTPNGGKITVQVQQNGRYARVNIIDTGFGISEEDQARLFTQFFRSESVAVREQIGWGLGLSIVKKMVEAQGGEISCESKLGVGSNFSFTVPLATTEI
ncbi:MAG: GAF domain-containing protein [Candidatus Promineifilaceae bacterium]